ncbi:protein tyrosine/serine phosphatase [Halopolyspora algeriensis]|uniref:Protein tyrosine/serine phosphatase n=1 Tax=Halopolyspora algeriensis TaxID=1500506 RepID=A0A368VQ60_9ACTN|nr:tyrosine-protein phosphatase [Halopolyspora algeriensis]RCW44001.1 protein tyrosine/serine phosphatase [Halopolyspora algeriensis]TQM53496.1 protein tyrosine/serine phosphatase [Halopolyspora algeriensis]
MTDQEPNALDGLVNLRDLGGLPTEGEAITRPGVLYRSDAPHAGDRAPAGMPQWPPKAVVDLRDTVEEDEREHPLAPVSRVYRIPVLEDLRTGLGREPSSSLRALYERLLEGASKRLVEVFRVAVETDGPVLIHCAAGKDRTGVVCALLARAAGVRSDAIVADYVSTDRNMWRVLQRLAVSPTLPPGVDREAVSELISAPASAIEAVLARLDENEGGAAGWLQAQGAGRADITRWQQRFLAVSD